MNTTNLTSALPMETALQLQHALQTNRGQTLMHLYRRTFPVVRHYVQQHGGTVQDAQDVFQDALVVFYEKAVSGSLVLTASAGAYVVAVAHNLWRREVERRQRGSAINLDEEHLQVADETDAADLETATNAVLDYVERLGEKCKSLLLAFYYFQQPLKQIAGTHQYRNVRSATVQKFKCLERLRNSARDVLTEAFYRY